MTSRRPQTFLFGANSLAWVALTLAGATLVGPAVAAPKTNPPPFANPVEQTNDMLRELREIKALLQEQNRLLRAGLGAGQNAEAGGPQAGKRYGGPAVKP